MNLSMSISEIMTKNVLFVHYNNKLGEVERLMKKKNIRHVPVIKEGKLSGIISLSDLERISFTKSAGDIDEKDFLYDSLSVEDVMMSNPTCISNETSVKDATEVFIKENFYALPVVENEILVGIVTTTDVMKCLLHKNEGLDSKHSA